MASEHIGLLRAASRIISAHIDHCDHTTDTAHHMYYLHDVVAKIDLAIATMSSPAAKVGTEDADAQATSEPEWAHLKRYGYAPGDYMNKCHACGKVVEFVDKRAITCRPCAEAEYVRTAPQPPEATAPAAPVAAVGEAVVEKEQMAARSFARQSILIAFHAAENSTGAEPSISVAIHALSEALAAVDAAIEAALAIPQARSSPLTADEVLVEWSRPCYPQDIHIAESFEAGVRYAERAHGILPAASMGAK